MTNGAKVVHFIGICGAGMSAVAKLMRDAGWAVSGSDAGFYPPVSTFLEQEGLPCKSPYAPENIPADCSLVVIGKHAKLTPEQNEEVRSAFERREQGQLEIASYPDVLQTLTQETHNIVVVGSYGKSTTTTLLAWSLAHAGADPSYFIGAIPLDFTANAHKGEGDFFVLEGDEYPSSNWDSSPKFLHYNATTVLLTSCEQDHFNEFPTLESYLAPYRKLVSQLTPENLLVACLDGKEVEGVIEGTEARLCTYSGRNHPTADWFVSAVSPTAIPHRFTVQKRDHNTGEILHEIEISTTLLGEHNVQNIVGCVAALVERDALSAKQIQEAIQAFRGLRRRLELKSTRSSLFLYEDLSSSRPKAVAALRAVQERHPNSKVVAIFQPHTFSFRSRKALEWYPGMFEGLESVLVFSPPNLRGLKSGEELSHEEIWEAIQSGNACTVTPVANAQEILESLNSLGLTAGDVVLFMTSGGMEGSIQPVIDHFEREYPVK